MAGRRNFKIKPREKAEELDAPTPEQLARGGYRRNAVQTDEGNMTMPYRNRRSNIIDKWFDEGWPGFEQPALLAINWCHSAWEARGTIGKLCSTYEPTIPTGSNGQFANDIEIRDDLDNVKAMFHPEHWRVFENVVRWGMPAGRAGTDMADNPGQAIASARTTVGLVANFIAMKRGY